MNLFQQKLTYAQLPKINSKYQMPKRKHLELDGERDFRGRAFKKPKKGIETHIRTPEPFYGITQDYLEMFGGYGDFLDWVYHGLLEPKCSANLFQNLN